MEKANLYRSLRYGLIAGFISTLIMDLISLAMFSIMGESLPDFFTLFSKSLLTLFNVDVEYPLWQGIILHYSIGMITGMALSWLTQVVRALRFNTNKKGIFISVIVTEIEGAFLFFLMSVILDIEGSEMALIYGLGSFLHLIWGACLGAIITFGQKRTPQIPAYSTMPVKNG